MEAPSILWSPVAKDNGTLPLFGLVLALVVWGWLVD